MTGYKSEGAAGIIPGPRARYRPASSERPSQQPFEGRSVPAAQGEARAVPQNGAVVAMEVRQQLLHSANLDDGGAVDADEAGRIEVALEPCHRVPQHIFPLADVERDVVVRRPD